MNDARAIRHQPPAAGTPAPFRFPAFERTRLANGVDVIVAQSDAAPLVSVAVLARAGGQTNPLELPGLASLHAGLLDEGTTGRDAMAIARTVERFGGVLRTGVDWDVAAIQMGMLTEHLDHGLALIAELAYDASFPEQEIERLRDQRLGEILRSRDRPAALANRTFAAALYDGTVYGQPLIGTEASLEAIGRDHVTDFYRRHIVPAGLTILVVGDIDPVRTLATIDRRFGEVANDGSTSAVGIPFDLASIQPPPPQRRVIVVDRPDAAQTEIQLGHVSVPRTASGYPARVLLNAILGGSFTSRLNLNLRERLGLTYGVRSSFALRTGAGPFFVRAAVDTDGTGQAVEETLREIVGIREGGVTEAELDRIQRFLIGVFPYTVETVDDLAQRIEDLVVYELDADYYDRHPARLAEVTVAQVDDAARRYLDPDRMTIVAVGPASTLTPQLEPFGAVEVVEP